MTNRFRGRFIMGHTGMPGERNPNWRGDGVGYSALHEWVTRQLGSPRKCETCGSKRAVRYEWANISGEYKRLVSDWRRLCKKCHNRLDQPGYRSPKNRKGSSLFKGVRRSSNGKKWTAAIRVRGREWFLGNFENEEDAAIHYNVAVQIVGGPNVYLNPLP